MQEVQELDISPPREHGRPGCDQSLLRKAIKDWLKNDQVTRRYPDSLYSAKTFEAMRLKPALLKAVRKMGFYTPTKIQEILPFVLADPPQNVIAQSQSGTGKSAAFILAMLSRVDATKNYPQVVCLTPTYELAVQIANIAMRMRQFCPQIKIRLAIRGEEVSAGTMLTEHIIIGTPGKLGDWALEYRFFELSKLKVFVLDEADLMIATQELQDQCFRIIKALPSKCQMMFFSATFDEDVLMFSEAIVNNPLTIRLMKEDEVMGNIKQYCVQCDQAEKYAVVSTIYGSRTSGQAMIFCNTRQTASWLAEKLTKDGHEVALLSGELKVEQRLMILTRFREGKHKVIIATSLLARGIDIEGVKIVVNFDLPVDERGCADCETYLHRIGRTGRFGKAGLVINLVDSNQTYHNVMVIQNHFGINLRWFLRW